MRDYNNYNINPPKVRRYHYYNPNSAKKQNKMPKNFSYVNNNEFNYQFYNNNINNGYNIYPNINQYQQMIINNENEIRNTENLVQAQNESNIAYKDSNNHSIINESRSNNSILNTSEKRHLYYFNDLKYEN